MDPLDANKRDIPPLTPEDEAVLSVTAGTSEASAKSTAEAAAETAAGTPKPGWERETLEKLAFASLKEQRIARRWKIFFRLAFLALAALVVWGMLDMGETKHVDATARHTAVINLTGEIAAEGNASAEAVTTALQSAFKDSGTAGVIIRINSPGGSPVQAGMINDEIRRLRAQSPQIPLHVVVEEICASGGYYVAAAADKIFVNKASIVGSIGVLMDGFGFAGLMEKVGVERRLLTAGDNKGMLDPFSPQSPKHREYAQKMLAEIHGQFIKVVREGRGNRLKENEETFSGLFWSGQRSIELGLADGFGTVEYVAREVIKAEDLVDYTVKENVAERLAKRFGTAVGWGAVKALSVSGMGQIK